MNHQTKTFDEILYEINNLTAENFDSTFKSIINFPDEEQKGRLYDIFLNEIKTQMINYEGYEDTELLEKDILTMTNDMIEIEPSVEQYIIANDFNLESIVKAKEERIIEEESFEDETVEEESFAEEKTIEEEILSEEEDDDELEIDIIENKIVKLETEYTDELRKELLLIELNKKIENLEQDIEIDKESLVEGNDELNNIFNERIGIYEEEITSIKEDINNLDNNYYDELTSADINLIMQKNDIEYDSVEKEVKIAITNGEVINYKTYQIDKKIEKANEELDALINNLNKKTNKEFGKETPITNEIFSNISDEELERELEILTERKEKIWLESYSEELTNLDDLEKNNKNLLIELNETTDKIAIVNKEIEIRKLIKEKNQIIDTKKVQLKNLNNLKITRNAYYEILDDSKDEIKINNENQTLDDSVNEFLNNHRRISRINSYENGEKLRTELSNTIKNDKEIKQLIDERKIQNKKLWIKALAATAGFASGLAMSCVPGVGTIRMGISLAKLAGSTINIWTKKHPNGKIAKVKNNVDDKLNSKFPRIMEASNKMREKLKETPLNCFVNGVAAGYFTGNIIEKLTGETLIGNIKNAFTPVENEVVQLNPEPIIPDETPEIEVPEQTPIVDNPNIDKPVTPTVKPEIGDIPQINEDVIEAFLPKEGAVYDLSALAEGLVSSDATNSVDLMQSLGKEVVFDKAVQLPDGKIMWHFKQLNGAGYAWFNSTDVQELMSKASEVVSKTM